jgi:hypothetical protein
LVFRLPGGRSVTGRQCAPNPNRIRLYALELRLSTGRIARRPVNLATRRTAQQPHGKQKGASVRRSGSIGPQVAGRRSKNGASASADDCRQTVPRTRTG